MFDNEYWIIFIRHEGNSYYKVAQKRWKIGTNLPNIGKNTYVIDPTHPTYILKNKRYYLVDFEKGCQLLLEKTNDNLFTPNELDSIFTEHLIRDLTHGVSNQTKDKLIWLIMGLIIGALVCFMIASIYYNQKIQDLLSDQAQMISQINDFSTTSKIMFKMMRVYHG